MAVPALSGGVAASARRAKRISAVSRGLSSIVRDETVPPGESRVEGPRITVRDIKRRVIDAGEDPHVVAGGRGTRTLIEELRGENAGSIEGAATSVTATVATMTANEPTTRPSATPSPSKTDPATGFACFSRPRASSLSLARPPRPVSNRSGSARPHSLTCDAGPCKSRSTRWPRHGGRTDIGSCVGGDAIDDCEADCAFGASNRARHRSAVRRVGLISRLRIAGESR